MSEMEFSPMEALFEAVHDVFLKFVFFYDLLVAMARAAGLYLILAAHGRLAVFDFCDVMRGAMAIQTESAIHLLFPQDVLSMHAGEDLLVDPFMALCAGSSGNRV